MMDTTSTSFPSPAHTIPSNPHFDIAPQQHFNANHHVPPSQPPSQHFSIPTLPSHANIGLGVLDGSDASVFQPHPHPHPHPHLQRLQSVPTVPILQQQAPHQHQHHQLDAQPGAPPPPPPPPPPHSAPPSHGQFGMPGAMPQNNVIAQLHQEEEFLAASGAPSSAPPDAAEQRPHGQLVTRIVPDPPNLEEWRQKLFNVDDTIVLTNDQFEMYFPHIDNVYSHRSTQKYKRKPFVSHYWDCRMKGRPPGTPKSDDPSKKKRKRNARERDLCDVKIKITEYFPGATVQLDDGTPLNPSVSAAYPSPQHQHFGGSDGLPGPSPPSNEKYWTIQRVNGNGGNGKGDGVAGPHKHTLEKSDEIKKSSVQRYLAAQEKEAKKSQKPLQKKPTGAAQMTAKKHSKDHELKLYAACFCPFSQRVWIALEVKRMQYQYCETDPFKRPTSLLEANPRGLVPAIREGDWASGESTIILEYLEDRDQHVPLFPTDPRLKANCRLWIDHINSKIVPGFFALLRAVDLSKMNECTITLQNDITALVQAADERGPYFLGGDLCLVDIHFAPFVLRLSRMLSELRGWSPPLPGTRWHQWVEALEQNPHIQATTSAKELYSDTCDIFLNSRQPHGET